MQKGEQSIATEGTISSFLSKLSQNQKQTFINKIKDYIKAVRAWIKNVLSQYKDTASADAKALRQMDEAYAKVEKLWADMMEKATRTNNALENAKEAGEDLSGVESKGGKQYSIQLTEEEKHKRLATIRNNMSMRVDGDKLDNAIDFVDTVLSTGGIVDDYGFVTAWHRTNMSGKTPTG
ncbi:MAG: hypothetical protein ILP10_01500, partial [Lachnospiraceae bacterium]|nr:hypothetical protein [Lachnospiraceae bacterium]